MLSDEEIPAFANTVRHGERDGRPSMSDWGVGMPAAHWLDEFSAHVAAALAGDGFYGVYLVGSALESKQWRDVDVRVILSDEEFAHQGFGDPCRANTKRLALELAFSALAKHMTGLPVDFQIQQQTDANVRYKGRRSALIPAHLLRSADSPVAALAAVEKEQREEIKRLAALSPMATFGAAVIEAHREDCGDLDGGWLEDEATRCGLLCMVTVTESCGDDCRCAEYFGEWPAQCLRYTPDAKQAFAALGAVEQRKA